MFKLPTTKPLNRYIKSTSGYIITDTDAYNILINKLNFEDIDEFKSQVNKICCNKDIKYRPSTTGKYNLYNLNNVVLKRLLDKLRASNVFKLTKNQLIVYNIILTVMRMNNRLFQGIPYRNDHLFISLLSLSKANYFLWLDIKNGYIFPLWDNNMSDRISNILNYSNRKLMRPHIKPCEVSKPIKYIDSEELHKDILSDIKVMVESDNPKEILDIAFYNNTLAKDSILSVWDNYPKWYKSILRGCWG